MKERPILFQGEMVHAILDGRKTQTRRVVKPQPPKEAGNILGPEMYNPIVIDKEGEEQPGPDTFGVYDDNGEWGVKCPYGIPGDRLFVKETHYLYGYFRKTGELTETGKPEMEFVRDNDDCFYAENPPKHFYKGRHEKTGYYKRPSIFMERRDSRILLEITDIRVERVQDISEEGILSEGIFKWPFGYGFVEQLEGYKTRSFATAHTAFRFLWNSINEKKQVYKTDMGGEQIIEAGNYSWDKNPWCWVVEFRSVKP